MDDDDDAVSLNFQTSTTTKIEKIAVLICPNCKTRIPLITLLKDETFVRVELNCSLCNYKDKFRLVDYLLFVKNSDSGQKCELKFDHTYYPATRFCLDCFKWICNQCISNHFTFGTKHSMIPTKLVIYCSKHSTKKTSYLCETCQKLICKTCTKDSHKSHQFRKVSNKEANEKDSNSSTNNQSKEGKDDKSSNEIKTKLFLFQEINDKNQKNKETLVNLLDAKIRYLTQLREDLDRAYETNVKNNETIEELFKISLINYEHLKNLSLFETQINFQTNFIANKEELVINYSNIEDSTINMIKFLNKNLIVQMKSDIASIGLMKAHSNPITCIIQLQDERLVTGSQDKTIKIWNCQTMQCVKVVNNQSTVLSLLQVSNGNLLSGLDDGTIKVLDIKNFNCVKTLSSPHEGSIWGLIELKNKPNFVSVSSDKTIKVWSWNYNLLCSFDEEIELMTQITDQRIITTNSSDKSLNIWEFTGNFTKEDNNQLIGHEDKVNAMIELKDYRFASGSKSEIIIWNLNKCIQVDKIRVNMVYSLLFLNDGTLLVGAYNSLMFIDSSNGEFTNTIEGKTSIITNLIELKDKRIAMTTWDSLIQLYNF